MNKHTQPEQLEKYSFWWSEVRLVVAAVALFIGGVPPIYLIFGYISPLYGLVHSLLILAWLISGIVSVYMFYRWNSGDKKLFGGKESLDMYAFFVSVVSGLNLGLAGLLGTNIGMSISSNRIIFFIVGLLYLASAAHLKKRWLASGQKIF